MLFGIREICDVVFKAKANQKIGNRVFYKGEPVIYFDSLKTSSLEGAATTVYAQGGRGNARLIAWEGERTLTFTMEDALISPLGFSILSGAGLIDASATETVYVHTTQTAIAVDGEESGTVLYVSEKPSNETGAEIYIMPLKNGEVYTEPLIGTCADGTQEVAGKGYPITLVKKNKYDPANNNEKLQAFTKGDAYLVDFYVARTSGATQIEITADKFGGNFYVEASTLFRNKDGVDMPAEFVIPNAKIQSNFTFSMASSGDPSTFTFTMDAFPDYTRFNQKKKVMAAIQVITDEGGKADGVRTETPDKDEVINEAAEG